MKGTKADLITYRLQGGLFDFEKEKVQPYFKPVLELIGLIEIELKKQD